MIRVAACLMIWISICVTSLAGEITLIYPRVEAPDETFVYSDDIDSTFVFGHISPPDGDLEVNGQTIRVDDRGAFQAFLPLRRAPETQLWEFYLIEQGDSTALRFAYQFESEQPTIEQDTVDIEFPRVVRVAQPNSHLRTMPGGSYFLFPEAGTDLVATGREGPFLTIDLGGGDKGAIESRFAVAQPQTELAPNILGNAEIRTENGWCVVAFEVTRPVPWRAEPGADGHSLRVRLYDTRAAVDQVRFRGTDTFVEDVVWDQGRESVTIELRCRDTISRGYRIDVENGQLTIRIRSPEDRRRGLKGKTIVVDPGHGGDADGAIGPLGNREKDIVLRWAGLLADHLERRGAVVVLTRDVDKTMGLYERIEIADGVRADFFISLHANALPDGVDPATRKGTGTYYYHSHSRAPAERIHRALLKATGLLDDGLFDANFAVARPTAYPAVLVELAYLMHPQEERLLLDERFLDRASRAITNALHEYHKQ